MDEHATTGGDTTTRDDVGSASPPVRRADLLRFAWGALLVVAGLSIAAIDGARAGGSTDAGYLVTFAPILAGLIIIGRGLAGRR